MSELSRLRWLCRRGMKELDLVLTGYLENHYSDAGEHEQAGFRKLLELQDPELYGLVLGKLTTDDGNMTTVLRTIRKLAQSVR
ncbi:MAG: succinate dehydrogenase assembly factor 2 [Gammaproteobacteria bacterium]|nr:succinate dehydrogenase assembly factor 2 [Gammaproteobacteria bacterium]HXK56759.1 succinate dehydrogenase assembly factor 2 [Gammaproteobacteria bacterium]